MWNRRILRRYIEHFLRYSERTRYKNIILVLGVIGSVEAFQVITNIILQWVIKEQLSQLFSLENKSSLEEGHFRLAEAQFINTCLNASYLPPNRRSAVEILDAFDLGYMQMMNAAPQAYTPRFSLLANSCSDVISIGALAMIDNVARLYIYGMTLKFSIEAIPPLRSEANHLDEAILQSLMIGQKEESYFPAIIAEMAKRLGWTETTFDDDLKEAGVWMKCPLTHAPILFPITTHSGKSCDISSLWILKTCNMDPLMAPQPLRGIYYNNTLHNIIYYGIRDELEKKSWLSEPIKQAFMAQWRKIKRSFERSLGKNQLVGKQPAKKDLSLFYTVTNLMIAVAMNFRSVFLPSMVLPYACIPSLLGWQNPLPQVCGDFESTLQLATKGFQGAFEYGLESARECMQLYTIEKCNTTVMKAASLNKSIGRMDDAQRASAEFIHDWISLFLVSALVGQFILLLLIRWNVKQIQRLEIHPDRTQDVNDALRLIDESTIETVETGSSLQQLQKRYREIQSQPNAQRDNASAMELCTGCGYSFFRADNHNPKPCGPNAELIKDWETTSLVELNHLHSVVPMGKRKT